MEERPHALLLKFPGTNCDAETARALQTVGFSTEIVPISKATNGLFEGAHLVMLSGEFSYGDYVMAGRLAQLEIELLIGHGKFSQVTGSFGNNWDGTPIGNALPVEIADSDDRRNCDQPVFARPAKDAAHPITNRLPWSERPPIIGGFNAFTAKSGSETLLQAVRFEAHLDGDHLQTKELSASPLLVTGIYGSGRTAALATDVAPHWIGPMVDWGTERITARADSAGEIEVGNLYAAFFHSLLSWTSQLNTDEH